MGRRGRESQRQRDAKLGRWAGWATIVVVPLTLIGLFLAYLDSGGDQPTKRVAESAPPRRDAAEAATSRVAQDEPRARTPSPDLRLVDATPVYPRLDPAEPRVPAIDVKLHNKGDGRIVLSRLNTSVDEVVRLDLCYTQGDLPSSNTYDVELPTRPATASAPLHQQLGPDRADRFLVKFGVPQAAVGGRDLGDPPHFFVYRMRVSVSSGSEPPLSLGRFIFSFPRSRSEPSGTGRSNWKISARQT